MTYFILKKNQTSSHNFKEETRDAAASEKSAQEKAPTTKQTPDQETTCKNNDIAFAIAKLHLYVFDVCRVSFA